MEIKISKKERIKSIDKVLDLLEFLSVNEQEIGIAEMSKKLNMGLSTTHRILTTLKSRGYINQNEQTAKYRLGIKLFELGCAVQNTAQLVEIAKTYLRQLSKITNETLNIAVLEDKEVIYLTTINSLEILRTEIRPGTRTPAHCTALGKVLLASLSDREFKNLYKSNEPIISLTSNSISSLEELKKQLKKIKKQGYAIDMGEYKIGINCLSVPIFYRNQAIAAISITGPASRFNLSEMRKTRSKLISIAKEISNQL